MECKWLLEKEKVVVKNEKKRSNGILMGYGIVTLMFAGFIFLANKNAPEHMEETITFLGSTYVFIIALISITFFIVSRKQKKQFEKSTNLRQELEKSLKTLDDYQLIDVEVYGNLKRKVGLGRNEFTFTPHFLIEKFSEVDYKVIKLQNVSYMETSNIDDYGYTEFFDKSNISLGKIKNTAYDCRVFNEICEEQIPWAQLK